MVLHLVGVCLLVKGGADWRAPHPDDQPNQTGTGLDLARGIMVLVLWKMVIFNDRELAIAHYAYFSTNSIDTLLNNSTPCLGSLIR